MSGTSEQTLATTAAAQALRIPTRTGSVLPDTSGGPTRRPGFKPSRVAQAPRDRDSHARACWPASVCTSASLSDSSQNTVGNEWLSLFPKQRQAEAVVRNWRDILIGIVARQKKPCLSFGPREPGSFLKHKWSFHGVLTVAEEYVVFPLFHPDFPAAVNYCGIGRLLAKELLRGL
ncbi:hypothetical protein MRX96_040048 [Rhipicephalus microplus]